MKLPYALFSIEEWRNYLEMISLEEFMESYPHAFLVKLNSFDKNDDYDQIEFVTIIGDQPSATATPNKTRFHEVYEVKKQKRLYSPMISLGRTANNDIVLDSTKISKLHSYFIYNEVEKKYFLVDLKSTNKTWLNQKELEPSDKMEVQDGDKLNLAKIVEFQFLLPSSFHSYIRTQNTQSPN